MGVHFRTSTRLSCWIGRYPEDRWTLEGVDNLCSDGQPGGHGWEIQWCAHTGLVSHTLGMSPHSGSRASSRPLLRSRNCSEAALWYQAGGPAVSWEWWHLPDCTEAHVPRLSLSKRGGSREWGSHVAGEEGRSCEETGLHWTLPSLVSCFLRAVMSSMQHPSWDTYCKWTGNLWDKTVTSVSC
jgi:hypothetical protein